MSMTNVETWNVDLANVGAIYPWVGSEVILWIIGVVFWLYWHWWQARHESRTYAEDEQKYGDPETVGKAMRGERL